VAHVTLIRPPLISTPRCYSVIIAPPLGLAYVAAALEQAGHRLAVIDALGEAPDHEHEAAFPGLVAYGLSIDEIVARIPDETQGIGISVMFSQQWPHVEALVEAIHARHPTVPIFLGGEHPTGAWRYLLEHVPAVTMCALGEGEGAACDIADWLDGALDIAHISGIAYRVDGVARRSESRPRVRELDTLPWPAWHLFPMEQYLSRGLGHGVNRGRSIPMLATRGCPFQCTFCSSPAMWTTRYYVRPVCDVVDEIAAYVERYGMTNVDFEDLTAFIKRDWILELCGELERRQLGITYQLPSGTRSEALDREVLEALYRTGCRNLTYAPESGSERTLKRIKKKVNLERMLASMRAAIDVGIVTKVNMIIGFPFEDRRDVWQTIRYCLRMSWHGVEDIPLFPYVPYPGSEIWDDLRRDQLVPELSNEYFAALGYSNLRSVRTYSQHMGTAEITFYRTAGMIAFIVLSHLRFPSRVVRTVRNLVQRRNQSAVEQRLQQLLAQPVRRLRGYASQRPRATASPS
jgi:radical SAM superfamily enzyme YgiQ (UPF0313 family)